MNIFLEFRNVFLGVFNFFFWFFQGGVWMVADLLMPSCVVYGMFVRDTY